MFVLKAGILRELIRYEMFRSGSCNNLNVYPQRDAGASRLQPRCSDEMSELKATIGTHVAIEGLYAETAVLNVKKQPALASPGKCSPLQLPRLGLLASILLKTTRI